MTMRMRSSLQGEIKGVMIWRGTQMLWRAGSVLLLDLRFPRE
jgi:hypothetical protein